MRRSAVVAAVVAATVVMAALATSATGDGAQLTLPAMNLRLQGVVTVAFVVLAALAIVALVFARPGAVVEEHPRGRRSLLSSLAVVVLAVMIATVLSTVRGERDADEASPQAAEVDRPDTAPVEVVVEPRRVATALMTLVVVGVLVALAVRSQRGRDGGVDDTGVEPLRSVVRSGRAALDHGGLDGEARQAILACWRALEAELSRIGRPRRDHETGEEYLRRALAPLDPPADAVARLAGRVELARWSVAPLDASDVSIAGEALDEVLADMADRTERAGA